MESHSECVELLEGVPLRELSTEEALQFTRNAANEVELLSVKEDFH